MWALGLIPRFLLQVLAGLRHCTAEVLPVVGKMKTKPGVGYFLGSVCCLKSNPPQCCSLVRGQLSGVGAALGLSPSALGFVILSPDFVPATKGLMAQTAGTQQSPDCHENGKSLAGAREL